jgi:endonuclease/exonuclease/phosphatase family metal-dependent hydrolase
MMLLVRFGENAMKLASYNVENLFLRARAMNGETRAEGADALAKHAELNAILSKKEYEETDKTRIKSLMKALGIDKSDDGGEFVILRQNRGHLVKRSRGKLEVVANGRGDWIGSVDLKMEAVNEVATRMTAKVIHEVGADVIGVVEAESRPSLVRFQDDVMALAHSTSYEHIMLIDGNDERGIDVAIMTRTGFAIESICSHVDDEENGKRIFSRDCAEYHIKTPSGEQLIILVNHFKSKGFGSQADSNRKRELQARRVKAIYEKLRGAGAKHVAVIGDFNDTPDSDPLAPLVKNTDLKDITEHANFNNNGRPGTFGNGTPSNKIDYILLSPALFQKVTGGEIFRMGVWGGKNGTLFPHFPEITKLAEAASDHAAITAEFDL